MQLDYQDSFGKRQGSVSKPVAVDAARLTQYDSTWDTEVLRNPRSGFVAYVPPGSVKKGEALVTTGAGKTTQCALCHGAGLEGLGPVPGIAGRSPSYVVRQLHDMQLGARKGIWTDLMKPVVAKLTAEDMLNIAAYTASRAPGESRRSAR